MIEKLNLLGYVKLTQLQPTGLIINTPSGEFYDPSRRMVVDSLQISPLGIEAITPDGKQVLDIHHIDHPDKKYDNDDLVCIGFSSHYAAMRARFGEHMVDGVAGENIIIQAEKEIWPEELGQRIGFESSETGDITFLDVVKYAAPCEEFSHFAAQSQHKRLPAAELKATLQFLGNGRRGYLLVLSDGQEPVIVQPQDRVFVIDTD